MSRAKPRIDVDQEIALVSRAFALFYKLQCVVAFVSAPERQGEQTKAVAFLVLAIVAAAVCVFGVREG